ncbi:murein hydrolase activator EnvC family protein [Paenibacillus abyssi]|uniref:Peptidase M23 n=1 Tax=Paenibacillus abyssi TaxID=1340531 RepID=A0A917D170_9BACL|nr:M23 family metallopeptidase [Paenibacillus abyssi]GGG06706.1 peptidase M23 [Paenibacillus abyssi]
MKKQALTILAVVIAAAVLFQPTDGEAASEVDKINKEIQRVRTEMKEAANNKTQAEQDLKSVEEQKEQTAQSINEVMNQINTVAVNMQNVNGRLVETEAELLAAGQSLEDAEMRIQARDELLQSRIRLLYTSGFVSYMDVLLSSTNFTDFIDRFDALQSILNQDKDILDEHKKDKELIIQKKQEVETKLAEVRDLYGRLEAYHTQLVAKEKEKEVMILQYNKRMEELEDISAEQEELLMALAKKVSALEKEKNRVETHYKGGKLLRPIGDGYRMSSQFGPRTHPITGVKGKMHNGVDFAAPQGTAIYAAESGVVIVAQATSGYGNTVIIDHGAGLWTLYAHIKPGGIKVESGEKVKRGQKIAEVGTTGNSTGPHLHFEVRQDEKPVNPLNYIR